VDGRAGSRGFVHDDEVHHVLRIGQPSCVEALGPAEAIEAAGAQKALRRFHGSRIGIDPVDEEAAIGGEFGRKASVAAAEVDAQSAGHSRCSDQLRRRGFVIGTLRPTGYEQEH
jgi:hypothetical protein